MRDIVLILLGLVAVVPPLRADLGSVAVSSDFDAEFARAADLLESGRRTDAESVLAEIRARAAEPAWDARALLLLARDDAKRRDYASAARRLSDAPAQSIGLEPYRRMFRADALAASGDLAGSVVEYRAALADGEPFAMRLACARSLAAALEKQGRISETLGVLASAAALASGADATAVALDRIRIGSAAGDLAAIRVAARGLVLSGTDPASLPRFARRWFSEQEARLDPAERATVGRLALSTDASRAARLLSISQSARWPASERSADLLAAARAQWRLGHLRAADRIAAAIPADDSPAWFEARLFVTDSAALRLQNSRRPVSADALASLRRAYGELSVRPAPLSVRVAARERLIRMECDAGSFDDGLEHARALVADAPGSNAGFEPLWHLAWDRYRAGDFSGARRRFEGLAAIYPDVSRSRRLTYWRARCLEREQRGEEAQPLYLSLASAVPADLYAQFARRRLPTARPERVAAALDPATADTTFRRADELLRLRLFEAAAAEARALPPSRGREIRLAEAEFALGRFRPAAAAARRAFPEIGTAEEGRVPDAWRRLFYPIEAGEFLQKRALEFGIDPAILRALVRQESAFDPEARSRAGALGLTQLLPATAKSLSRSVLRVRYRRAFLYDPSANAQLGAAYLRRLADRFNGSSILALAAYNGGPTRMARVVRENPGLEEDELFESHPAYETRDYVRRVLLYAESYRELYPRASLAAAGSGEPTVDRPQPAAAAAVR